MIIVDIETTGIDPEKHSIVSIGAIDLADPKRQFYVENRPWEGSEFYEGDNLQGYKSALEVNGFTLQQVLSNKTSLKEAMQKFFEWAEKCQDKLIGGCNAHFDIGFLKRSAEICGMDWQFNTNPVDMQSLVYIHNQLRGIQIQILRSADCFRYVGLPPEDLPHNALYGAKLKAEAFSRILNGKNLLPEFKQYTIPDYLQKEK